MGNERKTENLVRGLLADNGYIDNLNIVIEEQTSDNPRIDKCLKNASKKGTGKGRPEFIISFKDRPDDLIVIECKADTKNHESETRKKYADYAVDGVLCYAAYLKDSFNVVAIAVSGETAHEMIVSHFLWLKGNYAPLDIQDKHILHPKSIFSIIKEQSKPISDEFLIKKAIEYNVDLHKYSIPEVERCTFISSILVALQSSAFLKGYKEYHNDNEEEGKEDDYNPNTDLIHALLGACKTVLRRNGIKGERQKIILSQYEKIKHNKDLSSYIIAHKKTKTVNTRLRDLILNLHEDILPYINGKVFDLLGKFYTQFIRYAGSDQKTGLVLTPHHITDFFCDIAELDKDDIVFDPCCGTGGFLVSAMNTMIVKAGNDSVKHQNIKDKQIIGCEKRADMFSHACSNMMMRGDGKSHIYFDDCFDQKLKSKVKAASPGKAFLNPPYDVGEDGQLEFVENALDCISKGGVCVSICQMSTVVSSKNKVIAVRKRLLEKHTLKAVFSMPNDLFHPIGVVTCILVFKAHAPHYKNNETFFGYFKDDGFEKRKNKGRIDANNKWSGIQREWRNAYINKKSIAGLSVMQKITAKDEWCAEAYMETDYSTLTEDDFIKTIKEYVAFQFLQNE